MTNSRLTQGRASLAALAALGLLAPHAAHAQNLSLNTGDLATVSGTGTSGTIGGKVVSNSTTSYSADPDSPGISCAVGIDGSGTFTLAAGGSLTGGSGSSGIFDGSSGPLSITGGSISAYVGITTNGSGPLNITGGSISANNVAIDAGNTSTITIMGGTFTAKTALIAGSSASINLYGAFDGLTLGQTQTLPSNSFFGASGTFTGTLTKNTAPQVFTYQNHGTIILHDTVAAAPEPSQYASLGLGVLGVAALTLRARRRGTPA